MSSPSRAELWAQFAAGLVSNTNHSGLVVETTVQLAAIGADDMLKEFDKRFEWYSGGSGAYLEKKADK